MSKGSFEVKVGLSEMLKGGVIMDVTDAKQAKIAEDAGAGSGPLDPDLQLQLGHAWQQSGPREAVTGGASVRNIQPADAQLACSDGQRIPSEDQG